MLKELIEEGKTFEGQKQYQEMFGYYISGQEYDDWQAKSLMYLQNNFTGHPQTKTFENNVGKEDIPAYQQMLSILKAFDVVEKPVETIDATLILENIFRKFQRVSNQ